MSGAELKSLVVFTHGAGNTPWWGVTLQFGNVVDKVMFSTKAKAEAHVIDQGIKRPRGGFKWSKTTQDLYNRYFGR